MAALVLILVVVLILIGLVKLSFRPSNFPPGKKDIKFTLIESVILSPQLILRNIYSLSGPRGWPLVGNLPLLFGDEPPHTKLQNLAKTYGPVIGLFVGPVRPFVSVTGYKAVKEALLNDDLIGRPQSAVVRSRSFGENLGKNRAKLFKFQSFRILNSLRYQFNLISESSSI